MGVKVESPRGFVVLAEGVSERLTREARAKIETVLERCGVTACDIENLRRRYRELGESGVDIQRLGADDLKKYAIDASHVKANRAIFAVLSATRKKGPERRRDWVSRGMTPPYHEITRRRPLRHLRRRPSQRLNNRAANMGMPESLSRAIATDLRPGSSQQDRQNRAI